MTLIIYFASVSKFCNCPGSKEGRIIIDANAHLPDCSFRKRLVSKGYTIDTSVTPEDFKDGYGLGVSV